MPNPPARISSVRLKPGIMMDSLVNALTGQGTASDPRRGNRYFSRRLTAQEISAAYEGSGMMAKIIDIPAMDKVREWRSWQASAEQIAAIEAEEKRLHLRQVIREAETYRSLGGGAIILGLPGDPSTPARIGGKGSLSYIMAVSRFKLSTGPIIDDYSDPNFGKPAWFTLATTRGQKYLHPSRVVVFKGDPVADLQTSNDEYQLWGRSRVERIVEAVQNSDSANGAFAGLVAKVRNVIIGIPGLSDLASTEEGEDRLSKRLQALVLGESLYNATLRDAGDGSSGSGETIDHRQVNWSGIPDVMMAFATFMAALSDIPATRLLGKSPDGQNSTGKSDDANYNKTIKAGQELECGPCLDEIDRYLVPSALGSNDAKIVYSWAPLDVPSEKERADTFKVVADALNTVQAMNLIPDQAFSKAGQNTLVEGGYMPGLEGALAAIPENLRWGTEQQVPDGSDPSALVPMEPKGGDPVSRAGGGKNGNATADAWLTDAGPIPLYVQRKLLNASDLIAWAKDNGFASTLAASDMHVTVLYSRNPVDMMQAGRDWREDQRGEVSVRPGGPRLIEKLGENAVVLSFASPDLQYRHSDLIEAGGSHDYDHYQPHVTISYDVPDRIDFANLTPFSGELRFGPEIFQPLDLDWKSKIKEE